MSDFGIKELIGVLPKKLLIIVVLVFLVVFVAFSCTVIYSVFVLKEPIVIANLEFGPSGTVIKLREEKEELKSQFKKKQKELQDCKDGNFSSNVVLEGQWMDENTSIPLFDGQVSLTLGDSFDESASIYLQKGSGPLEEIYIEVEKNKIFQYKNNTYIINLLEAKGLSHVSPEGKTITHEPKAKLAIHKLNQPKFSRGSMQRLPTATATPGVGSRIISGGSVISLPDDEGVLKPVDEGEEDK